ncbi:hypothetical protein HPP92_006524 [Vanilla planifolia]|uniref:Uncharacterized protein n=1 Tax=Vanilla planifolia TaxID=51239 RepID=A0A835RQU9_VANPL|nr:hypothetical protein HPP92_006524 [Vanilla planifolia]
MAVATRWLLHFASAVRIEAACACTLGMHSLCVPRVMGKHGLRTLMGDFVMLMRYAWCSIWSCGDIDMR